MCVCVIYTIMLSPQLGEFHLEDTFFSLLMFFWFFFLYSPIHSINPRKGYLHGNSLKYSLKNVPVEAFSMGEEKKPHIFIFIFNFSCNVCSRK